MSPHTTVFIGALAEALWSWHHDNKTKFRSKIVENLGSEK
jgi:hypothetical protein